MDRELLQNAEKFHKKQHRKKSWQKILSILGCIVVFCTTYALVLPAITEEKTTFCGKEEHTHEDACYEKAVLPESEPVLVCAEPTEQSHVHGDECYELQGGHTHEDACFAYTQGDLVCELTDTPGHTHGDGCYTQGDLLCTEPEGHVHGEACYTDGVLTCTEPEGHIHVSDCYEQVLVCTEPEAEGHTHEGTCYQQISTLICELEEIPGEPVLICTEPEGHIHGEDCYAIPEAGEEPLTCTLPEDETHTHGDRCYGIWELVCGLEEHTHDLQCASDPAADLESAAIWEKTFAEVELTGV